MKVNSGTDMSVGYYKTHNRKLQEHKVKSYSRQEEIGNKINCNYDEYRRNGTKVDFLIRSHCNCNLTNAATWI